MNEDKAQRAILYAMHAQERKRPITIRELAQYVRVAQWILIDFINETEQLKYWTVDGDGNPIKRQGLFLVEYVRNGQPVNTEQLITS